MSIFWVKNALKSGAVLAVSMPASAESKFGNKNLK